jgi:acetyltransferase
VRAIADPDNVSAEFAIIVRSDLKGQGLGPILMEKLVDYCEKRGTHELVGEALADNRRLIGLAHRFGFAVSPRNGGVVTLKRELKKSSPAAALAQD